MMDILKILAAPWAIKPEALKQIQEIYGRHLRGEKADLAAIEAAIGKPLQNEQKPYDVQNGVAIISLRGVIAKRMNLFSRISGGASSELLIRDIKAAVDDPEITGIVILIDSPGGAVDGTPAAAQAVRAAREIKPVIALADGLMASAAYWIGSAANRIYLSDKTTEIGSIGVVAEHVDYSRYEDAQGYRVTEITAGKYKRIASSHAPLSPDGFNSIKEQVDHIYSIFVDEVAANRGVSVETVLENMADGRIFIGQKGIDAGLADGFKSLSEVIDLLNSEEFIQQYTGAGASTFKGATEMNEALIRGKSCKTQVEIDAAVDAIVAEAIANAKTEGVAEAAADVDTKLTAARQEGADAERARILGIQANAMPGHEKLVAEMVADGKTSAAESAQRILAAEKTRMGQINADLAADAPTPAPTSEGTRETSNIDSKEVAKAAEAYVTAEAKEGRKVSYAEAVAHVVGKSK